MSIDELELFNDDTSNFNEDLEDLPWLIFSLCDKTYAIYSKHVTSIIVPPDKITPVPNSPEKYLGIINVRGDVYPVLDMRKLFNMSGILEQQNKFSALLDEKEKFLEDFVSELFSAVENNEDFSLSSNSNLCEFGKWYNEYSENLSGASSVLKKIKIPHENLHKCAEKIIKLLKSDFHDENYDFEMDKLLEEIKDEHLSSVKNVLRSAKSRFSLFYREVLVLLTDGEKNLAVKVDKVIAIDELTHINGEGNMQSVINSGFFIGVAENERLNDEILIIDEKLLINSADAEVIV